MRKDNPKHYDNIHHWLSYNYGKATKCESHSCTNKSKNYEWANISGKYIRDRKDYIMLCRSCHRYYDKSYIATRKALGKPVDMYSKEGSLVRRFGTITSAAKFVGGHTTNICSAIAGVRQQYAYGYRFEYADEKKVFEDG